MQRTLPLRRPRLVDLKGSLREPVWMKGCVHPWVAAVSADLAEVLMAAVTVEGTGLIPEGLRFIRVFRTSRAGNVFKLTRAHSSLVDLLRSDPAVHENLNTSSLSHTDTHTQTPALFPNSTKLHPWPHTLSACS